MVPSMLRNRVRGATQCTWCADWRRQPHMLHVFSKNIAEFRVGVPSSSRATSSLRNSEQNVLEPSASIFDSAAELCFPLRNVVAIAGGEDKKFISKEQALRQAVLSWLGCINKELLNAHTDSFVRHRRRTARGVGGNGAN